MSTNMPTIVTVPEPWQLNICGRCGTTYPREATHSCSSEYKTYADGLREAAEIARKEHRRWHVKSGRQRKAGMTDACAQSKLCAITASTIAEAIEAKAGEK